MGVWIAHTYLHWWRLDGDSSGLIRQSLLFLLSGVIALQVAYQRLKVDLIRAPTALAALLYGG